MNMMLYEFFKGGEEHKLGSIAESVGIQNACDKNYNVFRCFVLELVEAKVLIRKQTARRFYLYSAGENLAALLPQGGQSLCT